MRCFAAIEVPPEVVNLAAAIRAAMIEDETWASEKWVAPENLHATLAFWDDLSESQIGRVAELLGRAQVAPFVLTLERFVFKPRAQSATMAWLGLHDASGSAHSLARELQGFGSATPVTPCHRDRCFVAHVTLVRARRPHRVKDEVRDVVSEIVAKSACVTMSVSSVSLFSSTLTTSGPRYQRLERVELRSF